MTITMIKSRSDRNKTCRACSESKPLSEFYARAGRCKECAKAAVRANRKARIEYYRAYDRQRGVRYGPDHIRMYRKANPERYAAHVAVGNALRDGKLHRQPCEVCGADERIHAHHDDYSKPLEVRWLCAAHHRQWHVQNGPGQ